MGPNIITRFESYQNGPKTFSTPQQSETISFIKQKVLNNLKVSSINEELIKKIMYIQEFISEVQK